MRFRDLASGRTLWIGQHPYNKEYLYKLYVCKPKAIKLGAELPQKEIQPLLEALGVKLKPRGWTTQLTCVGCNVITSRIEYTKGKPGWAIDEELQTFYNSLGNRTFTGLLISDTERSISCWLHTLRDGITGEPEGEAIEIGEED